MSISSQPLRVLFTVQGEGRGHLTQALALAPMLRYNGHTVVGAVVGVGRHTDVPRFFRRGIGTTVSTIESPGFVSSAQGTIQPVATALQALGRLKRYSASLDRLSEAIDRTEPDVIVNFYEGLMGAHAMLRVSDVPVVAVGHQFMAGQAGYPLLSGQPLQRIAMQAYTRLVGAGASARLALSFYEMPGHGVTVTPPLLRDVLAGLDGQPTDGSIVVYLMEPALAPALAAWSNRNPSVRIHAFSALDAVEYSSALTFRALSGTDFLARMAVARGVVCTAGFETVSEALWLGKPVLMTPTPGHYEQRCNAIDAASIGAGVVSETLNLDPLIEYLDAHDPNPAPFRQWVARARQIAVGTIEEAAGLQTVPVASGDGLSASVEVSMPRATSIPKA